jgi:hypothetical protein
MFTYLTWFPEELEKDSSGPPEQLRQVRAVNARRPKEAAAKAALKASVMKHPHDMYVRVMRADRLNDWRPGVKKYWVHFERAVGVVKESE